MRSPLTGLTGEGVEAVPHLTHNDAEVEQHR